MNDRADVLDDDETIHRIGDVTVRRILDMAISVPAATLFPDWQPAVVADHPEWARDGVFHPATGEVPLPVQSWLVETGDHVVLIDTGAGAGKSRPFAPAFDHLDSPFLERLAAVGVAPEAVTHVLLTHLHTDHVGWNTRLQDGVWVPTFPNARYIHSPDELRAFTDPAALNARTRNSFAAVQDSMLPIVAAGRGDPIARDGAEVLPGFTYRAAYGHSPYHMVVHLMSGDARAIFTADSMHHPVQAAHPGWNAMFDQDPGHAAISRRAVLDNAADSGAQVFTAHFGASGTGHVARSGGAFHWTFA